MGKPSKTQQNKNSIYTKKICKRFLKKEGRQAYETILLGLHGFNGQKGVQRAERKLMRWRLQRIAAKRASAEIRGAVEKRAYKKFKPHECALLKHGKSISLKLSKFYTFNKSRGIECGTLISVKLKKTGVE